MALDGAHGTGKTTLLRAVGLQLGSWPRIEEGARLIAPRFGVVSSADWERLYADPDRHRAFLRALLVRQTTEETRPVFLADGTIYRIYAYAELAQITLEPAAPVQARYDVIFYCPLAFGSEADGFRSSGDREAVDHVLRRLIGQHHRGALVELEGTVEARTAQVVSLLA